MNLFGDLFDFDGDGKVDLAEELIGLDMMGFFDEKEEDKEPEKEDKDEE